jgi:hypothetical protein
MAFEGERIHETAVRAAAQVEALDDPKVVAAWDEAALAMHRLGHLFNEKGLSQHLILNQLLACATSAWWKGAVGD